MPFSVIEPALNWNWLLSPNRWPASGRHGVMPAVTCCALSCHLLSLDCNAMLLSCSTSACTGSAAACGCTFNVPSRSVTLWK